MANRSNSRRGQPRRLAVCGLALWAVFFSLAVSLQACPFCTALGPTLSQRGQQATVTALAEVVSQRPDQTTSLRLHKVLVGADRLHDRTTLDAKLDLSPRAGSLLILWGTGTADQPLEEFTWQATAVTETGAAYFVRAMALKGSTSERLRHFAPYLEHADPVIAQDAYLEFGHATFDEVARVADVFSMPRVRAWLADAKVPPERKGFYGLVLGLAAIGPARRENAEFLGRLVTEPEDDFRAGFDGILGGYLLLAGAKGFDVVEQRYLANPRAKDGDVRHALTALRFYHEYGHEVPTARQLTALRCLLERPEFAAAAITDLARWQDWEPLAKVAALYARGPYAQAETSRAIVGYLLACPHKQASETLAKLRAKDPAGVAAAEQVLSRTTDTQSRD